MASNRATDEAALLREAESRLQKAQADYDEQHRNDPEVVPPGKLEGQVEEKSPEQIIADALKNVARTHPRSYVYSDAINRAFAEYRAYHETLLQHSIKNKDIHDALNDFDAEVAKINKAEAARKMALKTARDLKLAGPGRPGEQGKVEGQQPTVFEGQSPCGAGDAKPKEKKRRLVYPKHCPPENVWLEFAPKRSDYHAQGVAWSDTASRLQRFAIGNRKLYAPGWLFDLSPAQIKAIYKIRHYLNKLKIEDDMSPAVDDLHMLVTTELALPEVTQPEITQVLRWIPVGRETGLDYRVFLFALGDFGYASIQQAIRPYPHKFLCRDDQSDAILYQESEFDLEIKKLFANTSDVGDGNFVGYFDLTGVAGPADYAEEPSPYPIRNRDEYVPTREREEMSAWRKRVIQQRMKNEQEAHQRVQNMRDERQRALHDQVTQFKEKVEAEKRAEAEKRERDEATQSRNQAIFKRMTDKWVAEGVPQLTAEKRARAYVKRKGNEHIEKARLRDFNKYTPRQAVLWTGLFLAEMYDTLEVIKPVALSKTGGIPHKLAPRNGDLYKVWLEDKIEQEAQQMSPYLQPLTFVNNRLVKEYPKKCKQTPKKCLAMGKTSVQFDHWIMDLPPEGEGRIVVTENRYRIKQILAYVFSKSGSTLCLLPRVELMLHFAHNLADQLLNRDDLVERDGCEDKSSAVPPTPKKSHSIITERYPDEASMSVSFEESGAEADAVGSKESKATFRNPVRDLPQVGCQPEPELPIRAICKSLRYIPPAVPERFHAAEKAWVNKYAASLYHASNASRVRPQEHTVASNNLGPLRRRLDAFHAQQWDAYNCRRFQFRKALWNQMNVKNYESNVDQLRFANAYWSLLPQDNRMPLSLLKTKMEGLLH